VRVAILALVGGRPLDENPSYREMALQLLHHQKFEPYWPPGSPLLLLFFFSLFGQSILISRAAMVPIYVVVSAFLHALVKEVSTRRAANLALLLFAFYPVYVRNSFNPSTEYPAAACLLGAVYFSLLAMRRCSWRWSALAGLFLGALALVRPSSLILIPLGALYCFLKTRKLTIALAPLIVSSFLISLWLVKADRLTGHFVAINSSNWQNFFLGNNPYVGIYRTWPEGLAEYGFPPGLAASIHAIDRNPQPARDAVYRATTLRYIISRPDLFLIRTLSRFRTFFAFPVHRGDPVVKRFQIQQPGILVFGITLVDVACYWTIMLMAIAVIFGFRCRMPDGEPLTLVLSTALAYAAPYWVTFAQPRFNFPIIPLFGVLAAIGFDAAVTGTWAHAFQPSVRRRRAMTLAVALFLYIQVEWSLITYLRL
jgi:4-amino-4-deoxy-L-arabinose transferase-like glycosyltransferase